MLNTSAYDDAVTAANLANQTVPANDTFLIPKDIEVCLACSAAFSASSNRDFCNTTREKIIANAPNEPASKALEFIVEA